MADKQFWNNRIPKQEKFTITDFNGMFPDDTACLDWLREHLYPQGIHCKICDRVTKHHRDAGRPSFSCDNCGHHEHPTAGTIFHKSPTPLRLWFHAIYLMASTRCGISAKQIQRETGVTYKTAWRMFTKIRELLQEGNILSGSVEIDETYYGGVRKQGVGRPMRGDRKKTPIVGVVERKGRVVAKTVETVGSATLLSVVREHVLPGSTVYSDEHRGYDGIKGLRRKDDPTVNAGYQHRRIHHSSRVYVVGDIHTNSVEGFWSLIKRGIGGVYHAVSQKYLQSYLNEYSFRYNHRFDQQPMFLTFLRQIGA